MAQMNYLTCLVRYNDKLTVKNALYSGKVKLSELKAIYDSQTPVLFIESWLLQLNLYANVEHKLNGDQIKELAIYMYDEIYMLNMAEFTLLFKQIKNGHYGPFYNRVDGTQLLISCRKYREERAKYLIEMESDRMANEDYEKLKERILNSNEI